MSNSNSGDSFGFMVLFLFAVIVYGIYQDDELQQKKEQATAFCRNMPDSCDCRVNISSGNGKYSTKEYYVTYKQNGQSAVKEF